MNISYILDHNDFLTFQLFTTSRLESAQRKRKRIRVIVPVIYLALGFWLYFRNPDDNYKLTFFLALFAIAWYFLYPMLEARSYKKKLLKYIMVNYKDTLPMPVDIQFENDGLLTEGGQHKTYFKDLEEINETGAYLFIKINTGQTLIFPKEKIKNGEVLVNKAKELSGAYNIPYYIFEKWKWG